MIVLVIFIVIILHMKLIRFDMSRKLKYKNEIHKSYKMLIVLEEWRHYPFISIICSFLKGLHA